MIAKIRTPSLRTKLLWLIAGTGILCSLLFVFLWKNIGNAWSVAKHLPPFYFDENGLVEDLRRTAPAYSVPEYVDGKNMEYKLADFFAKTDRYTCLYIYGKEDGLYRAGNWPDVLNEMYYGTILSWGTTLTDTYDSAYDKHAYDITFQNGVFTVFVHNYRNAIFVYPYLFLSAFLCLGLFFTVILTYISRKMAAIRNLTQEILMMSAGDLTHPIAVHGTDEIGTLGVELDQLRLALHATITSESESRQANQDLITAMSHDLRTPLTILKGYLEVLKLKRNEPDIAVDYIDRCLKKTDDIHIMTDRMFEYALIYEAREEIAKERLPISFLDGCLHENIDFLELAGFVIPDCPVLPNGTLSGDPILLKRVFHNLFSNILKYGQKSSPIALAADIKHTDGKTMLSITFNNIKRTDAAAIASNGIGLKSVHKILELHHGTLTETQDETFYTVTISLPVSLS